MTIDARLERLDWPGLGRQLWERGYATTTPILTPQECQEVIALYDQEERFRSRIDMARFRFGLGEYKYFSSPLPPLVQAIRTRMYPHLATVANGWMKTLGADERYPPTLDAFLARCATRGQTKPTPLILRYETGGYNCLHQDLYGDLAFPIQVAAFLSRRGVDYTGGEFLLVEQRPRAQSMAEVIPTDQGEFVMFATSIRPVAGAKGYYRANVRHGVSRLRSGLRYTLGIIFHDAR